MVPRTTNPETLRDPEALEQSGTLLSITAYWMNAICFTGENSITPS